MNKWLFRILLLLFSAVFLVSGGFLVRYFLSSQEEAARYDTLSNLVERVRISIPSATPAAPEDATDSSAEIPQLPSHVTVTHPETGEQLEILRQYEPVFQLNPDLIGWIRIDGTRIDYPVMYAPDRKDYYLTRNFYGEASSYGCIYIQENCDPLTPSDNVILYGHRMKDGSMFAAMHNYLDPAFLAEHPTITFDTLLQHHTYEILSVFRTTASQGEGFAYHAFVNAEDEAEFDRYVAACKALSVCDTGVDTRYGDRLITLSTCEYSQTNGRLVVVARQID